MFTLDDLIGKVGGNQTSRRGNDFMDAEVGAVEVMDVAKLQGLFPGEQFSETKSVAYLPLKMCHSLPKINKRGRCFTPAVLANSVASARDNLVNIDHALLHNRIGKEDTVIGHIKTASFNWKPGEIASAFAMPDSPIPMYALGTLYLRHQRVPKIIDEHKSGRHWRTSMECGHNWDDAQLFYRGEFIPVKDAECAMLECVERSTVRPYKGHQLAVCLGGLDKSVDFWGLALTQSPADDDVEIMGILSAAREVACEGGVKKRYFPIRVESFSIAGKTPECADDAVDRRFTELANIAVIGTTDAAEDGHAHEVLSDGTILPAQGHQHYLSNYSLTKGTRPRLTGRTDAYWESYMDSMMTSKSKVHLHTLNIDLRGSKKASEDASLDELGNDLSHTLEDGDMPKIQELDTRLKSVEEKLSSRKSGDNDDALRTSVLAELASIRNEFASINKSEEIASAVTAEIEKQVKAGTLLTKQAHETATAEAIKAIEDKHKEELDRQTKLQARLDEIVKLGVTLEATPYDDQPELTVKDHFTKIGFDDTSELLFKSEFRALKTMVELEKAKNPSATIEEKEVTSGAGSSAANTGKSKSTPKRTPLLAGGSNPSGDIANTAKKSGGKSRLLAATGRG
jgi:hypothetical protein